MKKAVSLICFSVMMIVSCQTKHLSTQQKIKSMKRLDCITGQWVTYSMVYAMTETWKKVSDTLLVGSSVMFMKGDTVLNERMSIRPGANSIIFTTKNLVVEGAVAESYRLQRIKHHKIEFEKTSEGKTSQITYHFVSPITMRILITTDGNSIESYNMNKVIK